MDFVQDGIGFKVIGSIFDDQEEGRGMTENDAKEYLFVQYAVQKC